MSAEPRPVWTTARVVESRAVADDIRRITLGGLSSRRPGPGSHVDVRVRTNDGTDTRSYSVVESDVSRGELTISVLRTPSSRGGSMFMHRLREGDQLACTQPLQSFELRLGAPRYVLLAGGIGITALAESARVLQRLGRDYRMVYLGRSRTRMAYVDDLLDLHRDRLELYVQDEGDSLDVDDLVSALGPGDRTELYVCGPIRLMDAVRRSWLQHGRPISELRYETFGTSGWYAPQTFTVEVPELGITTVVEPGRSPLEALAQAGADLMYDCLKGECGLCEVQVASLDGRIDHRDVFLSDDEKERGASLCLCVSRITAPEGAAPGSGRVSLRL